MPSLTVGAQSLRGFTAEDWVAYLDAAGYPKESRLPRNWQPAPAAAAQAPGSPPAAAARPARAPAGDGGNAPD
jgi:hypothetical protein